MGDATYHGPSNHRSQVRPPGRADANLRQKRVQNYTSSCTCALASNFPRSPFFVLNSPVSAYMWNHTVMTTSISDTKEQIAARPKEGEVDDQEDWEKDDDETVSDSSIYPS